MGWLWKSHEADDDHASRHSQDSRSKLSAQYCQCGRQPCICQGPGRTSIPRKPVNTVSSSQSGQHSHLPEEQKRNVSSRTDATSTRHEPRSGDTPAMSIISRTKAHHSSSRDGQLAQGVKIRRRRRKGDGRCEGQPSSQTSDSSEPYVQPLSNLWHSFLPYMAQSSDDQTIVILFKKIIGPAEQYVMNFYEDRPGLLGRIDPCLEPLGFSCREDFKDLTVLLETIEHPTTVIKHSLLAMLLSVIHPENLQRLPSLLPEEFLAMTKAIRQSSTPDHDNIPEFYKAFCAYRALGFYLRQNILQDKAYIKRRDRAIDKIMTDFEVVFQPWLRMSSDPDQRCAALAGLLQNTAELGIILYSQPSTFFFRWEIRQASGRGINIAIWPSLVKMYDEEALEIDGGGQCLFESQVETTMLRQFQQVVPKEITHPDTKPQSINPLPLSPKIPAELAAQGQQAHIAELSGDPVRRFTTNQPDLDAPDLEFANGTGINLNGEGSMRYDSSLPFTTEQSISILPEHRGRSRRDAPIIEGSSFSMPPNSFGWPSERRSTTTDGRITSRRASLEVPRDREARYRERSRSMSSAQDQTKASPDRIPNNATGRDIEERVLLGGNSIDIVMNGTNRRGEIREDAGSLSTSAPHVSDSHVSMPAPNTMSAPHISTSSSRTYPPVNYFRPDTAMEENFRKASRLSSSRGSQKRNGESRWRSALSSIKGLREQHTLVL